MIPGNINTDLISGADDTGYAISRSLRFNSIDSAYLSRTPSTAGNRRTWTWAGWVKISSITTAPSLFMCRSGGGDSGVSDFIINSNGTVVFTGADNTFFTTTQVLRDFSAWYHLVLSVDTTAATAGNRIRFYLNGSQVTAFNNSYSPTQNFELAINQAAEHDIGGKPAVGEFFNGYLADIHFIDGQALTPSSFGEFSATTGRWEPKAYTGTYGTNGFRLDFSDNSAATATTLGKDRAGSNNWTPNNLSVTAGAGNDSTVDTPTSGSQVDTGLGGQVTGNYATLNPLDKGSLSIANGNLDSTGASSWSGVRGTIGITSGKWYWEYTAVTRVAAQVGINTAAGSLSNYAGSSANAYVFDTQDGTKWTSNTASTYFGLASANNAVHGIAFDADNGTITFYRGGTTPGVAYNSIPAGTYFPVVSQYTASDTGVVNFGQRPFAYTAPSGFKALCDTNLPAPTIAKGSTVMDVKLYTGNGSTQTITGLNFSPDLVWIKERNAAADHALYDIVRGTQNRLESNTTDAAATSDNGLTAFNSDGFALGSLAQVNTNADTYVAWTWDAGSTTVTNTQGSITSTVRANPSAGFSVVTYTSTGTNGATIGHGLGIAPQFVIVKNRVNGTNWLVGHQYLDATSPWNYYLRLNATNVRAAAVDFWNNTVPTSTVVTLGTSTSVNSIDGDPYVAYCFAPVAGYSAMGSYVGNGSSDGVFVYTGFRPRWIMIKASAGGATQWFIYDTARNTSNVGNFALYASDAAAETSILLVDILSNGFKLRYADTGGYTNYAGWTYIYAAFAESPFAYSRAR